MELLSQIAFHINNTCGVNSKGNITYINNHDNNTNGGVTNKDRLNRSITPESIPKYNSSELIQPYTMILLQTIQGLLLLTHKVFTIGNNIFRGLIHIH